jgi:predicted GNAT family N-acyltransferase
MTTMTFTIEPARWPADRPALSQVRETVFVHEQGVPLALEWDEQDATARHLLARDAAGRPIGTGRLLPDGHIGRMAVLPAWRGRGVGTALLLGLLDAARMSGLTEVVLNAQCSALPFYERQGFTAEGPIFDDAGIPHRRMRLGLAHD